MEFLRWLERNYENTFGVLVAAAWFIGGVFFLLILAAFPVYLFVGVLILAVITFIVTIFKTIYLYFGEYRGKRHQ